MARTLTLPLSLSLRTLTVALASALRAFTAAAARVVPTSGATGLTWFTHFGFGPLRPAGHHERMIGHHGDLTLDQAGDVAQEFLLLVITETQGLARSTGAARAADAVHIGF